MLDEAQTGSGTCEAPVADGGELPDLIALAAPETLGRVVLAIAAMHERDEHGRCRQCPPHRPSRWRWWRRSSQPCPTWRVMRAELLTDTRPRFIPA